MPNYACGGNRDFRLGTALFRRTVSPSNVDVWDNAAHQSRGLFFDGFVLFSIDRFHPNDFHSRGHGNRDSL
jgi:hypothetical protein